MQKRGQNRSFSLYNFSSKNRKGLSTIIVTLILILVSLVAVGVIWVVVRNVIQTGTEGVGLSQFSLSAKILDVSMDNSSNNISLTVKRNAGEGELEGISFVFSSGENNEVITRNVSLKELEQMNFYFHLINTSVSDLISVSIVPLIKQDEKQITGIALDKYNLGKNQNAQSGQTACTPTNCSILGYVCGTWNNGTCSGTLSCGNCTGGQICNASGRCVASGNYTYALSCSYTDVSNAINSANVGDTVRVPTGSCVWNSALLITKGIYLIGAGIGGTVITNGISSGGYLLKYNPQNYSANDAFRLSGFEFNANSKQVLELGSGKSAPFTLQTKVRIDNNKFTNNGSSIKGQAIYNLGSLYGVVDNNIFERMGYPIAHSFGTSGDNWWANSPQNLFMHGSEYYMYFEDNIFNLTALGGGAGENILTDGEYASRYVFRYNTITNIVTSYSLFEMHGQQDEGPTSMPASFGAEIYGNQIIHGSNDMIFWKQRSGQSLIFLNNAIGTTTPDNTAYTSSICTCPVNYTALKVTHNSYWWGNRRNYNGAFFNSIAVGGLDCNNLINIPTLGRDIFSDTSSPGISSGTLTNLPATCIVGQGYWATSQSCSNLSNMVGANPTTPISGTLYKCTATNTWAAYYTPYTYPHPLTLT
jgi:hypothetical protein